MVTAAVTASFAISSFLLGWRLGHRRGWTEARDLIVPRLDALRSESEHDAKISRALLSSVRGGRP